MTSIFTSNASMVALQTLSQINSEISRTSSVVATGLRVASAADSPTAWSVAATIRSDNSTLGVVRDALSIGRATLDVTANGLSSVRENLQSVKDLLVGARQAGADRAAIQAQITGLQADMTAKAGAALVNGENFLAIADNTTEEMTKSIVASFSRSATGVAVETIDLDITNVYLTDGNATETGILDQDRTVGGSTESVLSIDISALTDSSTDLTTVDELVSIVDEALNEVITAETVVGGSLSRAQSQETFLTALMDTNERVIGGLVDANLEEESTRLQALQTQQQLAIQALAISNATTQSVLALFR